MKKQMQEAIFFMKKRGDLRRIAGELVSLRQEAETKAEAVFEAVLCRGGNDTYAGRGSLPEKPRGGGE